MEIRRCGETDDCFCMLGQPKEDALKSVDFFNAIEQQTLPEQLWSFEGLLRTLAQPPDSDHFPYPFYFAMLDGYRPEAVSLGHNPNPNYLRAEDAERFEDEIHRAQQKCGGSEDNLIDILTCAWNTPSPQSLLRGAKAFVAFRGQPLSATPSRLEQCLTIHWALGPKDERVKEEIWDQQTRVYKVEDYLGPCDSLEQIYSESFWYKGRSKHQQPVARISNTDTLPYLAAEHLLLARAYNPNGDPDFAALLDKKPGMAILPFTVLGQWRAAGVWSYRGKYNSPENSDLIKHLQNFGPAASRLLSTAVSQMVINSSNTMLFRALSNLPNADKTPLKYCRRVQRAFSNLWFSKSLTVGTVSASEIVHENAGAKFAEDRGCPMARIQLAIARQPEIEDLLGFDRVEFDIPFKVSDRDSEMNLIRDMLENLNAVILSEHQRARRRTRDDMRKKMDITAHEYANAINDLVIFADTLGDRAELSPHLRLQTVRRVASHMRGFAWILREVSKADSGGGDITTSIALSDFCFSRDDPTEADVETWKNYLYWEALYSAYVAKERHQAQSGDDDREFKLDFRFGYPKDLKSGTDLSTWERTVTVDAAALVQGMEDGLDQRRPHWPLEPMTGRSAKLDDLGRCSVMLWGVLELLRNACEKTAMMLSTGQARELAVTVTTAVVRGVNNWEIQVTIENPTSERPPDLKDYHWYEPMCQLLKNVKFENDSTNRRAIYRFMLEVR